MKKKLLFFFTILTFNCFSQQLNGTVKYGLILAFDEGFSKSQILMDNYNKARESALNISFALTFNKNESLFKLDNIINDGSSGINTALAYSEGNDIIYNSKDNFEITTQSDSHLGLFLITETKKIDWILTEESKSIDGYLCYKATSTLVVDNGVKVFKFPIVAWYCPKIAVSFGPKGYSGLPGLILELQERNIVYGLKSVVFKKENIKIEKPNKGKVVTKDELDAIFSQPFKN